MASREQSIKRGIAIAGLTLALLLAGIASVLWSEQQQRQALNDKQLNLQNNLQSLVIKKPGNVDIKLQAVGDDWQIHEPCTINVNPARLQPLLRIVSPAAFSYDAAEVDLEAAGLTQPLATVVANGHTIDIGNTDLSGERRYAKRGDRVEFIPEWILPLLDGGLSALSALEVFDDVITAVSVNALEATQLSITAELSNWQKLTAQQITLWPLADKAPIAPQYSVTIKSESVERQMNVYLTQAYTAIVFEDARCAYLLPSDSLSTPRL